MHIVFAKSIEKNGIKYNFNFEKVEYTSENGDKNYKFNVNTKIDNEQVEFRMFKNSGNEWKIENHKKIEWLSKFEYEINNLIKTTD